MDQDLQRPTPRLAAVPRSWTAASVLLVVGVLVAYPVFLAGLWAAVSFTGCFFDCSEPRPVAGAVLSALVAALLALPFAAVRYLQGAGTERRWRRRLTGIAVLVLAAAALEGWVLGAAL